MESVGAFKAGHSQSTKRFTAVGYATVRAPQRGVSDGILANLDRNGAARITLPLAPSRLNASTPSTQ